MINLEKLTESQRNEIIQDFITILASHEGFTLEEELKLNPDHPNIIRWQKTAQSLFDALTEAI